MRVEPALVHSPSRAPSARRSRPRTRATRPLGSSTRRGRSRPPPQAGARRLGRRPWRKAPRARGEPTISCRKACSPSSRRALENSPPECTDRRPRRGAGTGRAARAQLSVQRQGAPRRACPRGRAPGGSGAVVVAFHGEVLNVCSSDSSK
jgi:hypothetical protein